ncbi:MAG TPA: PRC-barrel domain-containing protein, partial [Nitrospira sp.]
ECDVIGMSVVDQVGCRIGQVEAIWELPGHPVIVVREGEREVLIPAARHFVTEVDVFRQRMTVRLIDGMIEES